MDRTPVCTECRQPATRERPFKWESWSLDPMTQEKRNLEMAWHAECFPPELQKYVDQERKRQEKKTAPEDSEGDE